MRYYRTFLKRCKSLFLFLRGLAWRVSRCTTSASSMDDSVPLTMPGTNFWNHSEEAVQKLEADPNTDWSKVDLEALRQHLLDMKAFTEEVQVISKKPIENGVGITGKTRNRKSSQRIKALVQYAPCDVKKGRGWDMTATPMEIRWDITCTTKTSRKIKKYVRSDILG